MPWAVVVKPTDDRQHKAKVVESDSGFRFKTHAIRVCRILNSFLLNLFMQRIEPKVRKPNDHQTNDGTA